MATSPEPLTGLSQRAAGLMINHAPRRINPGGLLGHREAESAVRGGGTTR
jgi:hypothetical protein